MIRNCDINEISDGRKYGENDMVKCDAGGCKNCFSCCMGMSNTIVLDPYDIYLLKDATGMDFQQLLNSGKIELNIVDGLILPNIAMNKNNQCSFLENSRCSIHKNRPGICRLFPLGRIYENNDFSYFVQKDQCKNNNLIKTKVKKWIDTDDLSNNHEYVRKWHYFIKEMGECMVALKQNEKSELINDVTMFILNTFFVTEYNFEDMNVFQFYCKKISEAEKQIKTII